MPTLGQVASETAGEETQAKNGAKKLTKAQIVAQAKKEAAAKAAAEVLAQFDEQDNAKKAQKEAREAAKAKKAQEEAEKAAALYYTGPKPGENAELLPAIREQVTGLQLVAEELGKELGKFETRIQAMPDADLIQAHEALRGMGKFAWRGELIHHHEAFLRARGRYELAKKNGTLPTREDGSPVPWSGNTDEAFDAIEARKYGITARTLLQDKKLYEMFFKITGDKEADELLSEVNAAVDTFGGGLAGDGGGKNYLTLVMNKSKGDPRTARRYLIQFGEFYRQNGGAVTVREAEEILREWSGVGPRKGSEGPPETDDGAFLWHFEEARRQLKQSKEPDGSKFIVRDPESESGREWVILDDEPDFDHDGYISLWLSTETIPATEEGEKEKVNRRITVMFSEPAGSQALATEETTETEEEEEL